VAERATSVEGAPLPAFEEAATTSGSGAESPVCLRSARRGAEPALISNFGRAGPLVVVAMFSSAGRAGLDRRLRERIWICADEGWLEFFR